MGCGASSYDSDFENNYNRGQSTSINNPNNTNTNRQSNQNNSRPSQSNRRSNQTENRNTGNSIPAYEPYLASRHDPTFNMKAIKDVWVGEGIKKMPGYVCMIEEDELLRKREHFWTSRHEGNPDTWELLRQFCEGQFNDDELKDLMNASGMRTYCGTINIVYGPDGEIYEVPNYCIHMPSKYDIPKYQIKEPPKQEFGFIVRYGIVELDIGTSNLCPIKTLKKYIFENFPWKKTEIASKYIKESGIRLFYAGKELKDKDKLFMYNIDEGKIVQMMVRQG